MKYLLDTNTAQAYIQANPQVVNRSNDASRSGFRVGISVIVLAELVGGIEGSQSRDKNMALLRKALKSLYLWPFDESCAYEYGRIQGQLKKEGRPIGKLDVMIASTVFLLKPCMLVTTDNYFQAIANLPVVNWLT